MTYIETYLAETAEILTRLSKEDIAHVAAELAKVRQYSGRLFILGNGGSAANASHAVNDFRKIAGIEAYAPTDNVAELTARINDDGWASSYCEWLKGSHLRSNDALLVLSVGGGSGTTSVNLVLAMGYARSVHAPILSIVGRDGGYARTASTACVLVPVVSEQRITPHAEEMQSVVLHLLATHPELSSL